MTFELSKVFDQEVLKQLRGRRTQAQLSRTLGFSFNQVYLWETGRRVIHWKDFVRYCETLKLPLETCLAKYFAFKETGSIHEILSTSLKARKKHEIAKELDVSKSTLSRWLSGISDPPLLEAFRILNRTHLNFLEFIDEVAGAGKLASIQALLHQKRRLKDVLYSIPFSGAIAPALDLKKYRALKKHRPGFLAQHLGITLDEEEKALESLLAVGQIELHEGKYRLKSFQVTTTGDKQRFFEVCQYWSERASKIPKKVGQKSLFGYRIFGISAAGFLKLRQAQIDSYHAISEILKEEQSPFDHVVVVNFQTFLPEEGG